MEITDKELLAICNLSNLKMEFADLENKEAKEDIDNENKVSRNHTISSLLEAEREAILNKKNDSQIRNIFRRENIVN